MIAAIGDVIGPTITSKVGTQVVAPTGSVSYSVYGSSGVSPIATGTCSAAGTNRYRASISLTSPTFDRGNYRIEFTYTASGNAQSQSINLTVV